MLPVLRVLPMLFESVLTSLLLLLPTVLLLLPGDGADRSPLS